MAGTLLRCGQHSYQDKLLQRPARRSSLADFDLRCLCCGRLASVMTSVDVTALTTSSLPLAVEKLSSYRP